MANNTKEEALEFIRTEGNVSLNFVEKAREYQGDIYLFGAGYHLTFVVGFMRKYGLPIKGILDNYKPSGFYRSPEESSDDGNIPIIKFDEFLLEKDLKKDCWFVISSPSAEEAIRETITPYVSKERIFSFETVLYTVYFPLQDIEGYRAYLLNHWKEFTELYDVLADQKSRETLVCVLKGRLSGQLTYFHQCCVSDQYFPADVIHFSKREVMADLGTYDGDTLLEFARHCPDYKAAYCFEPDVNMLPVLKDLQKQQESLGRRVYVIPKGAWDQSARLELSADGTAMAITHILDASQSKPSYTIETVAIDEIVEEPISYIKMDIEGSELRALHGAEKQIRTNRPKLAVCVYHKNEDILDIWNYLRSLVPGYRFYLRHHTVAGDETVLYAVFGTENI